jgi:hypothetical protein
MPRVTFVVDYDHHINGRTHIAYKAVWSGSIPTAHVAAARAAGAILPEKDTADEPDGTQGRSAPQAAGVGPGDQG